MNSTSISKPSGYPENNGICLGGVEYGREQVGQYRPAGSLPARDIRIARDSSGTYHNVAAARLGLGRAMPAASTHMLQSRATG